jgi:4-hydroxythreonine-4-phosphate dehydrogenase
MAAREEGIEIDGPAGADVLLAAGDHDAYLAMYHDQGHIPVKLDGRGNVLGLSIGAPVLFSTVAHGSGHDIAGSGNADPAALAGAIKKVAALLRPEHAR